mmetsp:Transcript_5263/g.6010  ORF Transcript_5263/g.6010 Transcript_5263/m.6010 type:complete len:265 (-) Transcript_5263:619-1413(-)
MNELWIVKCQQALNSSAKVMQLNFVLILSIAGPSASKIDQIMPILRGFLRSFSIARGSNTTICLIGLCLTCSRREAGFHPKGQFLEVVVAVLNNRLTEVGRVPVEEIYRSKDQMLMKIHSREVCQRVLVRPVAKEVSRVPIMDHQEMKNLRKLVMVKMKMVAQRIKVSANLLVSSQLTETENEVDLETGLEEQTTTTKAVEEVVMGIITPILIQDTVIGIIATEIENTRAKEVDLVAMEATAESSIMIDQGKVGLPTSVGDLGV